MASALASPSDNTFWIGIASGALGGILVQGVRVLVDHYTGKAARRRGALEEIVKAASPLRSALQSFAIDPGPGWTVRGRWWPELEKSLDKMTDAWYAEWSIRLQDKTLHRAMKDVAAATLLAMVADATDNRKVWGERLQELLEATDKVRHLATKRLKAGDLES